MGFGPPSSSPFEFSLPARPVAVGLPSTPEPGARSPAASDSAAGPSDTPHAKPPEPVPAFRFASQLFDLLPHPLRESIAHHVGQASHPLMHGLLSGGFRRKVRGDAAPEEGGEKRLSE